MKRVVKGNFVELDGKLLPINTKAYSGCYLEILVALKSQMDAMLSHHDRILFIRLEARPPCYTDNNAPMRDFMRKLGKRLRKSHKIERLGYLWVREVGKEKGLHYHLVIMVDQRAAWMPSRIIRITKEIAEGWDWTSPTVLNCFYRIERKNQASYNAAFLRASYLAKERSKGNRLNKANDYSGSRLKCISRGEDS